MIPLSVPFIGDREVGLVLECIQSGFVSSVGGWVEKFENTFASKIGATYAVSASSGTAALHLALVALGIGKDDYVAVPNLTFVATVNPVIYCGATPVLVDVNPNDWCMDVEIFEKLCKKFAGKKGKLKAVIPVHLYGVPCDIEAIVKIARKYGVYVVEDATEALGSRIKGKQVGLFGDIGCFSFNGNKLITTGAGGMAVTSNKKLATNIAYLSTQARDNSLFYKHNAVGFNYRMDSLSAAFGLAQLERMDFLLKRRRMIAENYKKAFSCLSLFQLHPEPAETEGSFWLYSIVLKNKSASKLIKKGIQSDIGLRPFFTPLNRQKYLSLPVWRKTVSGIMADYKTSVSDILFKGGINLPSSPNLLKDDQQKVIEFILANY